MSKGGAVLGTLTDASGTPVYSMNVTLTPTPAGPDSVYETQYYQSQQDTGQVWFNGVAPGTYIIKYQGPGFYGNMATTYWKNASFARDATAVTVQVGSTYDISQVMPAFASINGTITDSAGRKVTSGTAVLYMAETGQQAGSVVSTGPISNGFWGFSKLAPGAYKVGFTQASTATAADGTLAASYPLQASWYGGSTYSAASTINVQAGTSNSAAAIEAYDPTFLATWPSEQSGGSNLAEPYCQCASGDPINDATGAFYTDPSNDLAFPWIGPTVGLTRSYSSTNADSPFGYGWAANFGASLSVVTPSTSGGAPQVVQVTQENGTAVRFTLDSNNLYEAPPRVVAGLILHSDGTWAFTRRAKTTFDFTSAGVLSDIKNLRGLVVSYSHNSSGQVSQIGGYPGSISLTWTGAHVTGASDSAGRSVGYGYDTSGNLIAVTDERGNTSHYTYDSNHRLLTSTTPLGGATTNVYDSTGRVTSQTDAASRKTTWSYSGSTADETTTVTAPDGAVHSEHYLNQILASSTVAVGTSLAATTSYQYDEALELISQTDPLGKAKTYTWDHSGDRLTQATALGNTTTWTYDTLGDLTSTIDPDGNYSHNSYNTYGELLSATSASGNTDSYAYNFYGGVSQKTTPLGAFKYTTDSIGDVLTATDPLGAVTTMAYNNANFLNSVTDPLSHATTYTLDAAGNVLTSTDPLNRVVTYAYNADGNRISTTDAEGHKSTVTFDAADQKTATTDADGYKTTYAYGNNGLLSTVTDAGGGVTSYSYNAAEEKTQVNAVSRKTVYSYDLDGRLLTTTSPGGGITTSVYDADGEVTNVTDPDGNATTFTYDAAGHRLTSTDPLGRVSTTTYTPDSRVATITQPDGSTKQYTYDGDGNTLTFVNADSIQTTYTYDSDDRLISKSEPGGLVTGYTLDAAGNDTKMTRPDGSTITYAFDADNRVTSATPSGTGSTATSWVYGADGERTSMKDATGTTSYTYDADGQVLTVKNGAAQTVKYAYDKTGDVTTLTYPSTKAVTYAFDKAEEMTSVTDWSGNKTSFTWSADGMRASQVGADGVTDTRTYDKADRLTQIVDKTSAATLATYGYTYDAAGQLTADATTDPAVTALKHTYAYDKLGQIASAVNGSTTTAYKATPGGELTASSTAASSVYNSAEELTSSTTSGSVKTTYGYDGDGERTSKVATTGTTTYVYNPYGDLAKAIIPGGTSVVTVSDGDGLRQSRTVGSTKTLFAWDTQAGIPLLLDDGNNSYIYGPGTAPIAQVGHSSATEQYLHGDLVGSVRLITSSAGAAVGTTEYDPYGNRSQHTGSSDSSIGYTGAWTDPTTALVYLRARDYDPGTGQFTSVDPALDATRQPYEYGGNQPLARSDPSGLDAVGDFAGMYLPRLQEQIQQVGYSPGAYVGAYGHGLGTCSLLSLVIPACGAVAGASEVLGDLTFGAPPGESAQDLTFVAGIAIFYKNEENLAAIEGNLDEAVRFEGLYQHETASTAYRLGVLGTGVVAELYKVTDVRELLDAAVAINGLAQTSASIHQLSCTQGVFVA